MHSILVVGESYSNDREEDSGGSLSWGGGGVGFLSLALPAFLPSAILFFFLTQNKGEARAPRGPSPRLEAMKHYLVD